MGPHHTVKGAKVIEVIEVEALHGEGVNADPFRIVTQYWSLDGNMLAQRDEWEEESGD